jgi:hypothetical protein
MAPLIFGCIRSCELIVVNLEQHKIHQALQGGYFGPFVQDILSCGLDETGGIIPLQNYSQGFALHFIQRPLRIV